MNATIHKHRLIMWCAALLALMPVCGQATTKDMKDVDLDALIRETQRLARETDDLTLVWWIPEEFWSASLAQDPTMVFATEMEKEAILQHIRAYTMLVVHEGALNVLDRPTFRTEQAIRENIRIIDPRGHTYAPLPAGEIDAAMKDMTQSMEQFVAELTGLLGENTHILLFPCETETGARIAEAKGRGRLKVLLGDREFLWQLPLESLLVSKFCNECEEERNGSWNYCPWCGGDLKEP